jgi:hypothetical protein
MTRQRAPVRAAALALTLAGAHLAVLLGALHAAPARAVGLSQL